jgi:hypothetical protein
MTTTLLDAIAAARAGEAERAQLITAEVIRNNPDDPNAWYLLSQLVDSDSRRAVYLAKTLSLAPDHPRARAEYDQLPPGLISVAVPGVPPAEAIAADVMSVHVAEVAEAFSAAQMEAQAAATGVEPETAVAVEPAVPELIGVDAPLMTAGTEIPGLREPLSPEAVHAGATVGAADAAAVAAEYSRPQPPRAAPRPAPMRPVARSRSTEQALSILLGILMLLALIVLGMLAYLIFL